jgi:hypothetical protein
MKVKTLASPNLEKQWATRLAGLWPALKGSLTQVKKPCIRENCPACARGDKHPAWLLSFTDGGRRRCRYVPLALVSTLQQALRNGRRVEQLLYQAGPALLKAYRRQLKNIEMAPKGRPKR